MATFSSILAWKIPWTEEPGRLQSVKSQRVRQDLVTEHRAETQLYLTHLASGLLPCDVMKTFFFFS